MCQKRAPVDEQHMSAHRCLWAKHRQWSWCTRYFGWVYGTRPCIIAPPPSFCTTFFTSTPPQAATPSTCQQMPAGLQVASHVGWRDTQYGTASCAQQHGNHTGSVVASHEGLNVARGGCLVKRNKNTGLVVECTLLWNANTGNGHTSGCEAKIKRSHMHHLHLFTQRGPKKMAASFFFRQKTSHKSYINHYQQHPGQRQHTNVFRGSLPSPCMPPLHHTRPSRCHIRTP